LPRVHTISLDQVGELLDEEPPLEQLRGMLRLRQAQIEQTVAEERARLRRIEAHLRALEGSISMAASSSARSTPAAHGDSPTAVVSAPGSGATPAFSVGQSLCALATPHGRATMHAAVLYAPGAIPGLSVLGPVLETIGRLVPRWGAFQVLSITKDAAA
jgi:hypothetical protein